MVKDGQQIKQICLKGIKFNDVLNKKVIKGKFEEVAPTTAENQKKLFKQKYLLLVFC